MSLRIISLLWDLGMLLTGPQYSPSERVDTLFLGLLITTPFIFVAAQSELVD
jgi:hypothetical protein